MPHSGGVTLLMGHKMLQLLAIGEVMAEIRSAHDTTSAQFKVNFAGDSFNTAIYAARQLNESQNVGYMTRIGTEPLSDGLLDVAKSEGLYLDAIARDTQKNIGIYSVTTDAHGERSFHYWRNDSAARTLFTIEETALFLPAAKIIYLSGISLAILTPAARERLFAALEEQRKKHASLIAFDSNYRPALWENKQIAQQVMSHMWQIADIALPSIDDEMALFGETTEQDVIDRFAKRSWHAIAIKRGVRGPHSPQIDPKKVPVFTPAPSVIDTTAAGDSFNGGYLAALLSGKDEADCLLAGHNLASQVVGAPGAIMPKPN